MCGNAPEVSSHLWKWLGVSARCAIPENTGILVQNCYVEDGQGNRILVIDQNGCGVDQYVMPTPEYSADLTTAFQVWERGARS